MGFLVPRAGSVVRCPGSDPASTVEGAGPHHGSVESKPLPVAVHLAVAHVSARADTAVFVQLFAWRGLGHAAIVS